MIEILKCLSDLTRLRILNLILSSKEISCDCDYNSLELCVCEIEFVLNISQSNVSKHLNKLYIYKVLNKEKNLKYTIVKLNEEFINKHKCLIKYLSEQFKESDIFIKDKEALNTYLNGDFELECVNSEKIKLAKIMHK